MEGLGFKGKGGRGTGRNRMILGFRRVGGNIAAGDQPRYLKIKTPLFFTSHIYSASVLPASCKIKFLKIKTLTTIHKFLHMYKIKTQ